MSNSTLKYIGKRLVISLITLFVILMVLFLMVKFLPGSPINNEKLSASARAAIEAQYGLDQPIPVQFVRYIQNMLTGDFGVSFNLYKDMQVSSLVGSAAKLSMIACHKITCLQSNKVSRHNTGKYDQTFIANFDHCFRIQD